MCRHHQLIARQFQTIRAWKEVGLAKKVNEKTFDVLDETACLIDVYMRDSPYDTGQEPNWDACIDVNGGGWSLNSGPDWEYIWESPDFWVCTSGDDFSCPPDSTGGMMISSPNAI